MLFRSPEDYWSDDETDEQGVAEGSDKLQGTPVVSLSDFGDKDNKKDKYGRTVPKKLKKDDPRVKFHKEPKQQGVAEAKFEEVEVDEGLKHHVAAAAIAVAGALGGHAHAQSAPQHDTSKPAATATAQDSDKSPHDGAPKAEHKAQIGRAQV